MTINVAETLFAPAERAPHHVLADDIVDFRTHGLALHATKTSPHVWLILNEQRQIVYKNDRLADMVGEIPDHEVYGKRPGELLDCVHASELLSGCGTTEFCRECGAVNAILSSMRDAHVVERECRITTTAGTAHEFRVWSTPFVRAGRQFVVFSLLDIGHEKRRQALEQTFFHDINNILAVLSTNSGFLSESLVDGEDREVAEEVRLASDRLMLEIACFRRLSKAESGDLEVRRAWVTSGELCREVVRIYGGAHAWGGRPVEVVGDADIAVFTDPDLLGRVLGNMLKNALEASEEGDPVQLACRREGALVRFSVHNNGTMPRSTQLQIFQRSFTTKGQGRGIGTYSMKLFGERYLNGNVGFSTSEEEGTTFHIVIASDPPPSATPHPLVS